MQQRRLNDYHPPDDQQFIASPSDSDFAEKTKIIQSCSGLLIIIMSNLFHFFVKQRHLFQKYIGVEKLQCQLGQSRRMLLFSTGKVIDHYSEVSQALANSMLEQAT